MPDDELEALVASKFEFVVTCQIYGKLKASNKADDQWKAQCIDELLLSLKRFNAPVSGCGVGEGEGDGGGEGAAFENLIEHFLLRV